MHDGVAVRTDRAEVTDGLDAVFATHRGKRLQVMNVNEARQRWPVDSAKVQTTNKAPRAIVTDAASPRARIAFIAVHLDLEDTALREVRLPSNLLGRRNGRTEKV